MAFPDTFATGFSFQPAYIQGFNSIRGDFGGLFLGMGFFCLLGSITSRCRWLIVPVIFLMTKPIWIKMMAGTAGIKDTLLSDDLKISGSKIDLIRFLSLIDGVSSPFPIVTSR